MIPITDLHPVDGIVNVENAKQLAVGFTGENLHHDGIFISLPLSITTKQGIEAVKVKNRKQLSLGYSLDLEQQPGTFNGDDYDCRQKNIKYNHLALVERGRAGENVRINVDSLIEVDEVNNPNIHKNKGAVMPKIRLDGIEYEASQEVINALDKANTEIGTLRASIVDKDNNITKMRADADTMKANLDSAEKKVKDIPTVISAAVKERIALERIALDALPEEKTKGISNLSDVDIRKLVILEKFPEAKLDGENEVYLRARFDAACEMKNEKNEGDKTGTNNQKAKIINKDEKSVVINLDETRAKVIKEMQEAYKK
jgi:hypothetical protein